MHPLSSVPAPGVSESSLDPQMDQPLKQALLQPTIRLQSHESSLNQQLVVEHYQAERFREDVEARFASQKGTEGAEGLTVVQRAASSAQGASDSVAVRVR